jgi:hypothetical protein
MSSGRSLAGYAGSHPHQDDQSEAVNTKPGCRDHDFDEILISTLARRTSQWLGRDLPRRVERLGLPVTVVTPVEERLRDYRGPAGA